MDWNWYLLSFEGRINRAKWWLSLPIVLGWMLFTIFIVWMMRSAETRRRATTAWDHESEIEMLPHIGSPPRAMHVKPGS